MGHAPGGGRGRGRRPGPSPCKHSARPLTDGARGRRASPAGLPARGGRHQPPDTISLVCRKHGPDPASGRCLVSASAVAHYGCGAAWAACLPRLCLAALNSSRGPGRPAAERRRRGILPVTTATGRPAHGAITYLSRCAERAAGRLDGRRETKAGVGPAVPPQ